MRAHTEYLTFETKKERGSAGDLDLGPWQQIFYAEFDGRRRKRVVIKILGE